MTSNKIPVGYCQCGCGQKTKIARQDNLKHGHVRGQPLRYVLNHSKTPPTLETKFWLYVTATDIDQCWEWQGYLQSGGYGRFTYRSKECLGHRVSYELHYGSLPNGMFVCHKCDNRKCCNPHHLFAGTIVENTTDRDQKGRQAKGIGDGNVRLTETEVKEIRALYATGLRQVDIAARFGIHQGTVSSIVRRQGWKHVA